MQIQHTLSQVSCGAPLTIAPRVSSIVAASSDHTARLWKMASGETVRQYNGHHKGCRAPFYRPEPRLTTPLRKVSQVPRNNRPAIGPRMPMVRVSSAAVMRGELRGKRSETRRTIPWGPGYYCNVDANQHLAAERSLDATEPSSISIGGPGQGKSKKGAENRRGPREGRPG